MKIRQSAIKSFFESCQYSLKLYLDGVRPEPTEVMKAGTEMHKNIDRQWKDGNEPIELKYYLPHFNYDNALSENALSEKIGDIEVTGTVDLILLTNGIPTDIIDYKGTTAEPVIDKVYLHKRIQGLIYSYLVFKKYPKTKKLDFHYWFPRLCSETNIPILSYEYNRKETFLEVKKLIGEVKKAIDNDIFIPATAAKCRNCVYAPHCQIISKHGQLTILEPDSNMLTLQKMLNNVQGNIDGLIDFRTKLNSAIIRAGLLLNKIDDRLLEHLPDDSEHVKWQSGIRALTNDDDVIKWLIENNITYQEILHECAGALSISKIEKYLKKTDTTLPNEFVIPGGKTKKIK